MSSENKGKLLSAFFDGGAYTTLFGEGGVSAAYGMVGGTPAYAVCQNGGAVSAQDLANTTKTLELAAKTGNPVATFYNSTGTVLEGGLASLAATAKLSEAVAKISGVVPQVAVVTGVCGASSALAAANADVCVMAKDAELFLSAPFLSAAAGDTLEGAGSAESAQKAGVAAIVAEDGEAAAREAAKLLSLLPGNNLSAPGSFEFAEPAAALTTAKYDAQAAIDALADDGSAVPLYDGFGCSVVTALATVQGNVAGFVATQGPDSQLASCGTAKIARFVRLCDAFSIPVVTLINTGGLAVSSTQDQAGAIRSAARLAATYADATTAKVAVVTGKAIGSAFTALANADLVIAMQGAVIAPAEPTAAVSVLYKEQIEASEDSVENATAALVKTYEQEVASAAAAIKAGVADMEATPATLRTSIAAALDVLATKRVQRLAKKHGNMSL